MKAGDLVTPIGAIGRLGYHLWSSMRNDDEKSTFVVDDFLVGELGLVLRCVPMDDMEGDESHVKVLTPRGRAGWISTGRLKLVGEP